MNESAFDLYHLISDPHHLHPSSEIIDIFRSFIDKSSCSPEKTKTLRCKHRQQNPPKETTRATSQLVHCLALYHTFIFSLYKNFDFHQKFQNPYHVLRIIDDHHHYRYFSNFSGESKIFPGKTKTFRCKFILKNRPKAPTCATSQLVHCLARDHTFIFCLYENSHFQIKIFQDASSLIISHDV
jgi:hypothetical protein